MAQFQAYRNPRASKDRVPYLLDVQSDIVNIGMRLTIPLVLESAFGPRMSRINPLLEVEGQRVVVSTPDIAGLPLKELKHWVADCSKHRSEVISAIDFMLSGF